MAGELWAALELDGKLITQGLASVYMQHRTVVYLR